MCYVHLPQFCDNKVVRRFDGIFVHRFVFSCSVCTCILGLLCFCIPVKPMHTRISSVRENVCNMISQNNVKSHVFLDFQKKRLKT